MLRTDIEELDILENAVVYENGIKDELSPDRYRNKIRNIDSEQLERRVSSRLGRKWKLQRGRQPRYRYPALLDDRVFPPTTDKESSYSDCSCSTNVEKREKADIIHVDLPDDEFQLCYKDFPTCRINELKRTYSRVVVMMHP